MKREQIKGIGVGLGIVAIYFISTLIQTVPFDLLQINYQELPLLVKEIYSVCFQLFMILLIVFLIRDTLKKNFMDLKKNHQMYFKKYFKYWFLALGLMMISNLLIMGFTDSEIANNEASVRELFDMAPIYTFISAVLIAPVLEELVFRQGLRQIFSNTYIFILASGLIFGSMHVITDVHSYVDLLYIIPYSMPGFIFAYLLVDSKNIFVPMAMHFMHNGLLMSLQMFIFLMS